ncbi:MAG: PAS domain S-box protein, partial [Chloroflexota bacterium]
MKAPPLDNILESMGDAFVALDTEWRYTYMNQKAGQIFNRRPEDMIGKHIWSEFPEGIGQPFYKAYHKAVETQTPVYLEEYYPPYNRWFENRIYPSADGLAIFFQDITDRKQAEQALRESEERLARIVETVPDGIAIVNREGQITFANAAAERIFGLTRGGITDRAYDDPGWRITALDGSPFPQEELPFARVRQSGQPVYGVEHAIEHPDGRRVMLSINAAPLHEADGEFGGMVAAISDITERKQAEAALREAEAKYRTLVNQVPAIIYTAALDWPYTETYISPQVEKMLGFSAGEWLAQPDFWTQRLHPDDRERVLADVNRTAHSGEFSPLEYRLLARDGRAVWIHDEGVVVQDGSGQLQVVQGVMLDITDRKQAEAELERSLSILQATFESTGDGILVVGGNQIVNFNQKFAAMWGIPLHILEFRNSEQVMAYALPQLRDPEEFLARVSVLRADPATIFQDTIELKDGRAVEVYSQPQVGGGEIVGRV